MVVRTATVLIVLALAGGSLPASANSPASPDDESDFSAENYAASQRTLYDALTHDSSPRMQVLVGRIYLSESDEGTPGALRPKSKDVVARATRLAPDDVFVQWTAAEDGSYSSSQCGPSDWPEAEVANLVRLEPDNAAAWQFAVALERAKSSQVGIDETLSRMAMASRADDHSAETIAVWTSVYLAHPETASPMAAIWNEADATPQAKALLSALVRTGFHTSPAMSALEEVCKPDASTERTWQRAAWCADAATLLAAKGTSLALREQGLKLLAIVGDRSDAVVELQRNYDWLHAHSAMPMSNSESMSDTSANVLADWRDGANEIEATQRRLARIGQPSTPPPGWTHTDATNVDTESSGDDAEAISMASALQDYMQALILDLRSSSDVGEQALALSAAEVAEMFATVPYAKSSAKTDTSADKVTLGALAAANPDNRLVQWLAARSDTDAAPSAIANLQRLESDNAATWMLALAPEMAESSAMPLLQHIAASAHYDEHSAQMLSTWLAVVQRHPLPAALAEQLKQSAGSPNDGPDQAARSIALMATSLAASRTPIPLKLTRACAASATQSPEYQQACTTAARLLLRESGSVLAAMVGEGILRARDALDQTDQARARQLAWWRKVATESVSPAAAEASRALLDDIVASSNEVEAMHKFAERQGKGEPPADWLSPADKTAAKKQKSAK
jgi:hypothetical protein